MNDKYKLQIIDDSSFNLTLKKLKYDYLDKPKDIKKGIALKLRTKDNYKISEIKGNEVKIEFVREKYFEPEGLFKIEIVLIVGYRLKESDNKDKNKIIKEDLKNDCIKLLSPAATRASIIVSSLTGIDFKNPIVDPPYPLLKK